MTEHYYSSRPQSASQPRRIETRLRGQMLSLTVDKGVFAKRGIDVATRLLIETVQVEANAHVLDVGCGYGVIGIALAREASSVTMVDINERAVSLAKKNVQLNQLDSSRIRVLMSDRYVAVQHEQFDVIVTNPPIRAGKTIVYDVFSGAVSRLHSLGALWFVMHRQHGVDSAIRFCRTLFSSVETMQRDKGFRVVRASGKIR